MHVFMCTYIHVYIIHVYIHVYIHVFAKIKWTVTQNIWQFILMNTHVGCILHNLLTHLADGANPCFVPNKYVQWQGFVQSTDCAHPCILHSSTHPCILHSSMLFTQQTHYHITPPFSPSPTHPQTYLSQTPLTFTGDRATPASSTHG